MMSNLTEPEPNSLQSQVIPIAIGTGNKNISFIHSIKQSFMLLSFYCPTNILSVLR